MHRKGAGIAQSSGFNTAAMVGIRLSSWASSTGEAAVCCCWVAGHVSPEWHCQLRATALQPVGYMLSSAVQG